MNTTPDSIQKQILLRCEPARVWQALCRSQEFGRWFGLRLFGEFTPHTRLTARVVPTQMDNAVAKEQQAFAGMEFDLWVEQVLPRRLLSFRWHPYPPAPGEHLTAPTTLVQFSLTEVYGGTLLTITESGYHAVAADRRSQAYADNAGGWQLQTQLIARYLARPNT